MSWIKDRNLVMAMVAAAVLRALPLLIWPTRRCVRDECTYLKIAFRMVDGEGMTGSAGWLWAPGYPFLMYLHKVLFGYASGIKITQVVLATLTVALIFRLGQVALSTAAGRTAAWFYALSPVLVFFTVSLWSEVIYSSLLLVALWGIVRARMEGGSMPFAALTGVMQGCCVLFRGVATYMLPILAVALVWRRWRDKRAWGQVAAMVAAAMLVVAPYSIYASQKFDTFIVSDRTLGQMMWLGNNDFEPLTFDYGNGALSRRAYKRHTADGRKACAPRKQVVERDSCAVEEGFEWIQEHPTEFVARMPMRVAQLLNPHSLLTRHLRWGKWKGLPHVVDESLIAVGALLSIGVMVAGTVGLIAWGQGGLGVAVAGILLYHLAAISALAGLSRYRVPLEPLLMLFAAAALSKPRETVALLAATPWRRNLLFLALAAVIPLITWFLPAGWPAWRSW